MVNPETKQVVATAFTTGRTHDFALYQQSELVIAPETKCVGDSGYQGLDKEHQNSETPKKKSKHHPLTKEEKAANRELSRLRIVVEHVIARLKVFKILSERYRNRRKRFGLRFNLIAALLNAELLL